MILRRKIKRIETKKTDCRAKIILRRKIKRIGTKKKTAERKLFHEEK